MNHGQTHLPVAVIDLNLNRRKQREDGAYQRLVMVRQDHRVYTLDALNLRQLVQLAYGRVCVAARP